MSDQSEEQPLEEPLEEVQEFHEPEPLSQVEQLAQQMGWQPGGQLPAEQWIKAGNDVRRSLENKVHTLEASVESLQNAFGQKLAADHEQHVAAAKTKLKEAVREGREEDALAVANDLAKPPPQPQPQQTDAQTQNMMAQWIQENPWYQSDQNRHDIADMIFVRERNAGRPVHAALQAVNREMAARFPEPNPNREMRPAAESAPPRRTSDGSITQDDLNEAGKMAYELNVTRGGMKPKDFYASLKTAEQRRPGTYLRSK